MSDAEARPIGPRRVAIPLLVNHALILVGAWILVSAWLARKTALAAVGALVAAAGIGVEIALILWSVSLVHAAARTARAGGSGYGDGPLRRPARCGACGWSGTGRYGSLCPRCAKPVYPVP